MADAHDPATLAFYDREAPVYAHRRHPERNARMDAFLARLQPGAGILELGCGGGQDASLMLAAGFDVTPTDPATFVLVSLSFSVVAFLAIYLPARRATKINPMEALRHE